MKDIRAFARRIAKEFKPKRIILFGSYAYGKPTRDSDVDILVVFGGRGNARNKSLDIRMRLHPGYPLDVLTRSESEVRRRLAMNDCFLQEVFEKGKVLYEAGNGRMGRKGRS